MRRCGRVGQGSSRLESGERSIYISRVTIHKSKFRMFAKLETL